MSAVLPVLICELTLIAIFLTSLKFGYAESDLTLEMQITPSIQHQKISKFEIKGATYSQMCPSGQCELEFDYGSFSPPYPHDPNLAYSFNFELHDTNQTNSNTGPIEKKFLEPYSAKMLYCKIDDIQEGNGQELYYCHDGDSSVTRMFDSRDWYFYSIGIFDAKNGFLRVIGNYTGTAS
jgi:hypothetical protein